jgi:hypothetical protein
MDLAEEGGFSRDGAHFHLAHGVLLDPHRGCGASRTVSVRLLAVDSAWDYASSLEM